MVRVIWFLLASITAAVFLITAEQLFLGDTLGSDYTFVLTRLVYGYFWTVENGVLSLPWFSPAWCGGLPYFADPQVMFYSIPQLLLVFMTPSQVVFATFVLFGLVGAVSFYLLLSRVFNTDALLALTGACLFLFNEFFLFRMLIGHFTYHVFALLPLIALLVISAAGKSGWSRLTQCIVAGMLIAYFVHAGAGNFLLPGMLSVLCVVLLYGVMNPDRLMSMAGTFSIAGVFGFALSLSKLVAGYAYVRWFPREGLSLGVFENLGDALFSILTLLFMNPWIMLKEIPTDYLIQAQELRFGVTLAPLALLILGMASLPSILKKTSPMRLLAFLMIAMIVAIPLILSIKSEEIEAVLKTLPYFREMSLAVRWLALLIPLVIVLPLVMVNQLLDDMSSDSAKKSLSIGIAFLTIPFVIASHWLTEKPWDVTYDPSQLNRHYLAVKAGGSVPTIADIVVRPEARTFSGVDDAFLNGGSSRICYQPLFGYALEKYPVGRLREGSIFAVENSRLNLKDPACYMYPNQNSCKPGDHFKQSDGDKAARFATNQQFEWQMPLVQIMANWINLLALVFSGVLVLIGVIRVVLRVRS